MFKVNNRNTRIRCKLCSKSPIKRSERCHGRDSAVFIVKSEHISQFVSIINFEDVIAGSEISILTHFRPMFPFFTPWKREKTRGFQGVLK